MFGKIKDKLKNLFNKTEEVIEKDEVVEEEIIEKKPEKKLNIKKVKDKKKEAKKNQKKKTKKEEKLEPNLSEPIIEEENLEENEEKELAKEETQEEEKGFFSKIFKKHTKEENLEEIKEDSIEELVEEERALQDENIEGEEIEEKPKEGFFKKAVKSVTKKKVTEEDFEKIWIELEIFLLEINIAYEIVQIIEKHLKEELIGNFFTRFKLNEKIREVLSVEVKIVLEKREGDFLTEIKKIKKPIKILILGVNGTGKTTSIAKIVSYLQKHNLSVVLAAADTFRAAAIEQLGEHAKKLGVKIIQHKGGSDPAAVAFDAIEHAKAKNIDVVLIDTAGRMPNNSNLILELQKINNVSKSDLVLFVGDSISGNDLIEQIDLFNKAIPISGIILTKIDTDEKPGSIVTTAYSIEQAIYFLGIGQTYEDLIPFNAEEISQKLFSIGEEENES